jgi:hypothetical protein
MVFGPIVLLKSLYITRLAHCLYQKLPTYFSDEAKKFPIEWIRASNAAKWISWKSAHD